MPRRKTDFLTPEQLALKNKLEREICTCHHARIIHGATVAGLALGHGKCYVGGCRCPKFAWHHEIDLDTTAL